MVYDPLTYIVLGLMLVGVMVLLIQRRFATAAFGVSAGSVIVHFMVTAAMFETIATGDGFGWRNSPDYQPGSMPDWGWVNYAPQWIFDGPLLVATVSFVAGLVLVISFAVLRKLADNGKITPRKWFWHVGHKMATIQTA